MPDRLRSAGRTRIRQWLAAVLGRSHLGCGPGLLCVAYEGREGAEQDLPLAVRVGTGAPRPTRDGVGEGEPDRGAGRALEHCHWREPLGDLAADDLGRELREQLADPRLLAAYE